MTWRQILTVAATDLKRMLRRKDTLLWLVIMPLPYIWFFGVAFKGSPKEKTSVVVVAPEPDAGSQRVIAALEETDSEVTTVAEWTAPEPMPERGYRVDLPPRLGHLLVHGGTGEIAVWSRSGDMGAQELTVTVQKALLTLRVELLAHLAAGERASVEALATPIEVVPITVAASDWGKKRQIPAGFKQSIPGNMVMFVLMSVLVTGSVRLLLDREAGHLQRMLALPIPPGGIIASQFLSLGLMGVAESLYFLFLGRVVFGHPLGAHPLAVVAVLALMVSAASGVGILLGATLRTAKQAAAVGIFATLALSALGGCWWPLEILPGGMRAVALALPTGQTMHALIRLTVWDDPPSALLGFLVYMVGFAALSTTAAARILRKRLA